MSIREEIKYWCEDAHRRLFHVAPTMPDAEAKRELFGSEEINRLIWGPWTNEQEEYRCGLLWAATDRFVIGRPITMALSTPYKKPKWTYLARLDPLEDEVWEIRVFDPKPGIRIFGQFGDLNLFIALTWARREALPDSREWRDAREGCKAEWRKLFPTYDAITGDSVNEYVSHNAISV